MPATFDPDRLIQDASVLRDIQGRFDGWLALAGSRTIALGATAQLLR